ncbi:MAG: uracil-DNA glycosylase, partial [Azoarcus sp.]|nr:uracil-DNA glycosylase [Azoarcus sp.]
MSRRSIILREMGLAPLWRLRNAAGAEEELSAVMPPPEEKQRPDVPVGWCAEHASSAIPDLQPKVTQKRWTPPQPDSAPRPVRVPEPSSAERTSLSPSHIATLDWPTLEENIHACRACVLCEKRAQAVPGVGDRNARWMFVGEGPGVEEDRCGEPFVGPAGRLLDNMLAALGLKRGE